MISSADVLCIHTFLIVGGETICPLLHNMLLHLVSRFEMGCFVVLANALVL